MRFSQIQESRGVARYGYQLQSIINKSIEQSLRTFLDQTDLSENKLSSIIQQDLTRNIDQFIQSTLPDNKVTYQLDSPAIAFAPLKNRGHANISRMKIAVSFIHQIAQTCITWLNNEFGLETAKTECYDSCLQYCVESASSTVTEMTAVIIHELTHIFHLNHQTSSGYNRAGKRMSAFAKSYDDEAESMNRIHAGTSTDNDSKVHTGSHIEMNANATNLAYELITQYLSTPEFFSMQHNSSHLGFEEIVSFVDRRHTGDFDLSDPIERRIRNKYITETYKEMVSIVAELRRVATADKIPYRAHNLQPASLRLIDEFFNKRYARGYENIPVDEQTRENLQEDLMDLVLEFHNEPETKKEHEYIRRVIKRSTEYIMEILEYEEQDEWLQ